MPAVGFRSVWDNHPMNKIPPEKSPCRDHMGNPLHVNQCAVRMGATLWSIHIRGFYGVRTCGQSGHEGHALSAEELGRWLDKQPAHFGKTQKYFRSHKPEEKLRGKTGIVLCWDFWDSDGDGRLDGEHIDVWDGHRMAHGSRSYISGASAVWFWALS